MPPVLYDLVRKMRPSPPPKRFHSLFQIDEKLSHILDYDNGFFVELGANDGVTQSNSLFFERERNWRGVLIEPAMNKYLECVKNRDPDNHFVCAACVPFDFTEECVWLEYYDLMTYTADLEKDIPDLDKHTETALQFMNDGEKPLRFPARATTMNAILSEAKAPVKIDLLSLDVEGAELSVLDGIDHKHYRFRYIAIECRDIERLSAYLKDVGYEYREQFSHRDYLFADATA